jgi:sugar lactone lactonase YvrE
VTGSGDLGSAGDGGPAAQAQVSSPVAVAFDPAGNLLILEGGKSRRIRQIGKDGVITTLLDGANVQCNPNTVLCSGGPAGSALAIDGSGTVFVGDGNFVWRATRSGGSLSGTIFAGAPGSAPSPTDGEGGPAANASLGSLVAGLAPAPDGSLYLTAGQFGIVRRVAPGGTITTVAGTGTQGYSGDGGPARSAQTFARNIAVDKHGVLYIADSGNNRVRRVDTSGIITTIAGTGKAGDPLPGTATSSPLTGPVSVAVAPNGDLYVGVDNRIVKILGVASP